MKRNELAEIKKLEPIALIARVKKARTELQDLTVDKNMNKLSNLKQLRAKRVEIAQVLTILRQKQIVSELEVNNG